MKGNKAGRHPAYINNFRQGIAECYHVPQNTSLDKYKQHIVNDKYFKVMTSCNDDYWYANVNREAIIVCFHTKSNDLNDA
ncbi:hypothetical protein KPY62_04020 [Psychrobacter sp. TAE2020]|uniref:hypothetical protein n=1 Tax=Psychrobacter sp. TAE2020 TaxID=2846762 RepID=UPI001C105A22|nr:hypothetical protein [Psychrobacter sp. TAE2020]MBU5616282.1 hypothetical protein [Psychrobacter sp. TAE2020]